MTPPPDVSERARKVAGYGRLSRAISLAALLHAGQVDKAGQPYILHVLRVMLACRDEDERVAAVLHDTVEDCDMTVCNVRLMFGDEVADAVDTLTRRNGETYAAFVERCALNPIGRVVKLADLADNMDVRRLGREPTREDAKRLEKYADARRILEADNPAKEVTHV